MGHLNRGMIEAMYQHDLKKSDEVHNKLLEQAKEKRWEKLDELENQEREDYKYEQEFFFQG